MESTTYYSPAGVPHVISTDYTPSGYVIRLDGKLYGMADDRAELNDAVRYLVKRKRFSDTPKKGQKSTPLGSPASS